MTEPISVFRGHKQPVNAVRFLGDEFVLSGCADGSLGLWNIDELSLVDFYPCCDTRGVLSIDIQRVGEEFHILVCCRDGTLHLLSSNLLCSNFLVGQPTVIESHAYHFCNAAFVKNNPNLLLSGLEDVGSVALWDIRTSTSTEVLKFKNAQEGHGMVMKIVNNDSDKFHLLYEDGLIASFDIRDSSQHSSQIQQMEATSFDLHPSNLCCLSSVSGSIHAFTMGSLSSSVISTHRGGCGEIRIIDSQKIICGCWDHRTRICRYDGNDLILASLLHFHEDSVNCLDVNSAHDMLVTGSKDRRLAIWEI